MKKAIIVAKMKFDLLKNLKIWNLTKIWVWKFDDENEMRKDWIYWKFWNLNIWNWKFELKYFIWNFEIWIENLMIFEIWKIWNDEFEWYEMKMKIWIWNVAN